jgi:hypothetical protein
VRACNIVVRWINFVAIHSPVATTALRELTPLSEECRPNGTVVTENASCSIKA